MKVIFVTGNKGKLREVREILGEGTEVITMREAGFTGEIEESGTTFAENAAIKVRALGPREDAIVMADDSGIEIRAMDYGPGVYSARYMGEDTSYVIKNQAILELLADRSGEERYCRYSCSIAMLFPDGDLQITEGVMEGEIARIPAGEGGFGYDPIFFLPEFGRTVAEITEEEKNSISHRGKALRAAKQVIEERKDSEK